MFFFLFFTPPLRCLTFACLRPHTCSAHTDSHNISVAMVTLSEAPRFPGTAVALSDPPLCLLRSRGVRRAPEQTPGVSLKAAHFSLFCDLCSLRVRAYNSNEQTQECRTGCGKKIPERVYVKNNPEVHLTGISGHWGLSTMSLLSNLHLHTPLSSVILVTS